MGGMKRVINISNNGKKREMIEDIHNRREENKDIRHGYEEKKSWHNCSPDKAERVMATEEQLMWSSRTPGEDSIYVCFTCKPLLVRIDSYERGPFKRGVHFISLFKTHIDSYERGSLHTA